MTTITPTILADLRAKAEAANKSLPASGTPLKEHAWSLAREKFYAAANPTTILALCDALEARDAEIATLRAEVESITAIRDAYRVTLAQQRENIISFGAEVIKLQGEI